MKIIKTNLLLLVVTIILFGVLYPLFICGIGLLFPNQAEGLPIINNGKIIGYKNLGQNFTETKYFWDRPSACNYNPINAGPTNFGPTNPAFLETVEQRADTFLVRNPGIKKSDIPSELLTSSGSGLDPDLSLQGVLIQIPRIAKTRGIGYTELNKLVYENVQKPLFGILGPEKINVLQLNLSLDNLYEKHYYLYDHK